MDQVFPALIGKTGGGHAPCMLRLGGMRKWTVQLRQMSQNISIWLHGLILRLPTRVSKKKMKVVGMNCLSDNWKGTPKIRGCSQIESFSHLNRSYTLDFCRNFGKSLKESSYENYFYTKQPLVRRYLVHIKNMLLISYKNLILVPIIFLITKKQVFFIIAEYLHFPTDSKNIMVVMV